MGGGQLRKYEVKEKEQGKILKQKGKETKTHFFQRDRHTETRTTQERIVSVFTGLEGKKYWLFCEEIFI